MTERIIVRPRLIWNPRWVCLWPRFLSINLADKNDCLKYLVVAVSAEFNWWWLSQILSVTKQMLIFLQSKVSTSVANPKWINFKWAVTYLIAVTQEKLMSKCHIKRLRFNVLHNAFLYLNGDLGIPYMASYNNYYGNQEIKQIKNGYCNVWHKCWAVVSKLI